MFAEADLVPGSSPIVSIGTHWLARAFLTEKNIGVEQHRQLMEKINRSERPDELPELWAAVHGLLIDARVNRNFLDRKESLLAEPLGDVKSGYLAGYLLVKDLWTQAVSVDRQYHDKELFLCVLKSYFFDDYGLVAHILSPNTRDMGAAQAIGAYFAQRLRNLAEHSFVGWGEAIIAKADVRRLVTFESPTQAPSFDQYANLATPETLWKRGIELLNDRLRLLTVNRASGQPENRRSAWIMAQREMMALGHVTAKVNITAKGRVICLLDDIPVLAGPIVERTVDRVPPGVYNGVITAYLFPYQGFRAVSATVDGTAVLTMYSEDATDFMKGQFENYLLDVLDVQEFSRNSREVLELLLAEDSFIADVLTVVRESIDDWTKEAIVRRVLRFVPPERHAAAELLMNEAGFGRIVGSRKALRFLAWLSVATSFTFDLAAVTKAFEQDRSFHSQASTLTDAVGRVTQAGLDRLGDPLIFLNPAEGTVWSAV